MCPGWHMVFKSGVRALYYLTLQLLSSIQRSPISYTYSFSFVVANHEKSCKSCCSRPKSTQKCCLPIFVINTWKFSFLTLTRDLLRWQWIYNSLLPVVMRKQQLPFYSFTSFLLLEAGI